MTVNGCVSISQRLELQASTAAGIQLLEATIDAHGAASFQNIQDIAVSYDGEWRSAVRVFQPILIDWGYRKRSEERILLPSLTVGQRHNGPVGTKYVVRSGDAVEVVYDGVNNDEPLRDQAAAAVADGYQMFLLGPFFFQLRTAVIDLAKPTLVDGRRCRQLLAILRPGFGFSAEDRVLIAIDEQDHLVRRLRFTFNALPTTQGVIADVIPSDYVRIDGVMWPTRFKEIIKKPLPNLTVHEWHLTGLDTNRGLTIEDLRGAALRNAAIPDAGSLAPVR
jgi:hypothetical protein